MDQLRRNRTKSPYYPPNLGTICKPVSRVQQARANSITVTNNNNNPAKYQTAVITLKAAKRSSSNPKSKKPMQTISDASRTRAKSTIRQQNSRLKARGTTIGHYENIYGIVNQGTSHKSNRSEISNYNMHLDGSGSSKNSGLVNTRKLPELYGNFADTASKTINPSRLKKLSDVSGLDYDNPIRNLNNTTIYANTKIDPQDLQRKLIVLFFLIYSLN